MGIAHHSGKGGVPVLAPVDGRGLRQPELTPFQIPECLFTVEKGRILALPVPVARFRRDPVTDKARAEEIELRRLSFLGANNVRSTLQDGHDQELTAVGPSVVAVDFVLEAEVKGHDPHGFPLTPKVRKTAIII
jgi:hypothetical protein